MAASAGLAISSIGGLLIAIWFGLFGWQETDSAPYVGIAFTIEAIAAALLGGATVLMAWSWLSRIHAAPVMKPRRARPLPRTAVFIASSEPTRSIHPAAGSKPGGSSRPRAK